MAWTAFIDYLEEKLGSDGLIKVRQSNPNWAQYKDLVELRENVPEKQIIDVARKVGLISKTEMNTIQGLLSKRNEYAHPSSYNPGLNEALGYLDELIKRIVVLQNRKL